MRTWLSRPITIVLIVAVAFLAIIAGSLFVAKSVTRPVADVIKPVSAEASAPVPKEMPKSGGEDAAEAPAEKPAVLQPAPAVSVDPHEAALAAMSGVGGCTLDTFPKGEQFGLQLLVSQFDGRLWVFDPANPVPVAVQPHMDEMPADYTLAGCSMLVEGRKDSSKAHHIWIIQSQFGRNYLDADGKFRAWEMSVWVYPANWNMDDFSAEKLPIAGEFQDKKRANMQYNASTEYDWPIYVHKVNGEVIYHGPGTYLGYNDLKDSCNFAQPQLIAVTGQPVLEELKFNASIGAYGCRTVALIDDEVETWENARDNILLGSVTAYLMPKDWSQAQIDDFVESLGW